MPKILPERDGEPPEDPRKRFARQESDESVLNMALLRKLSLVAKKQQEESANDAIQQGAKDRKDSSKTGDKKKEKKKEIDSENNLLRIPGVPTNVCLAVCFIEDAIEGRLANGKGKMYFASRFTQRCFLFNISDKWSKFLYLCCIVHSMLILAEPPTTRWHTWTLYIEFFIIVCYILDVSSKIAYMNFKSYFKKKWHRNQVLLIILYFFDWFLFVVGVTGHQRYLRLLRPAYLLGRNRDLRRIFDVVFSMAPRLSLVIGFIFVFILLFCLIGVESLADIYYGSFAAENLSADIMIDGFQSVPKAFVHMFTLFTTENFPDFTQPAFVTNSATFVYFLSFMYVGLFFLLPVLLAMNVSFYMEYTEKQIRSERKKEWQGLMKAFSMIDKEAKGYFEYEQWVILASALIPGSRSTHRFYFDLLDRDGNQLIDVFDFLDLREVLQLHVKPVLKPPEPRESSWWLHFAKRIRKWKHYSRIQTILIVANSIVACVTWRGIASKPLLIVTGINAAMIFLSLLELLLRMYADHPVLFFRKTRNKADLAIEVIAVVLIAIALADISRGITRLVANVALFSRLLWSTHNARMGLAVFTRITPVMLYLTVFIAIVMYMFAVLGMQLFSGIEPKDPTTAYYHGYNCHMGFDSFGCTIWMLFQVLATNNWNSIMYAMMDLTGYQAALYWISFYIVVPIVLANMLAAVTIEAFLTAIKGVKGINPDDEGAIVNIPTEEEDLKDNLVSSQLGSQRKAAKKLVSAAQTLAGESSTSATGSSASSLKSIFHKVATAATFVERVKSKVSETETYRVSKKRGSWRREIIAQTDAMSVVEVKDLDKLAKMSKVDLKAIHAKKTESRQSISIARPGGTQGKKTQLSSLSPILAWYSESQERVKSRESLIGESLMSFDGTQQAERATRTSLSESSVIKEDASETLGNSLPFAQPVYSGSRRGSRVSLTVDGSALPVYIDDTGRPRSPSTMPRNSSSPVSSSPHRARSRRSSTILEVDITALSSDDGNRPRSSHGTRRASIDESTPSPKPQRSRRSSTILEVDITTLSSEDGNRPRVSLGTKVGSVEASAPSPMFQRVRRSSIMVDMKNDPDQEQELVSPARPSIVLSAPKSTRLWKSIRESKSKLSVAVSASSVTGHELQISQDSQKDQNNPIQSALVAASGAAHDDASGKYASLSRPPSSTIASRTNAWEENADSLRATASLATDGGAINESSI